VAKTNGAGTLTWQAEYEGFGTRRSEWGTTPDRQKANTKEEDPSGLVCDGHRYRDLETGVFMTKDPAGFVDGPNLYAYVRQNPWSHFDPEGLAVEPESSPLGIKDHIDNSISQGIAAYDLARQAKESRFGAAVLGLGIGIARVTGGLDLAEAINGERLDFDSTRGEILKTEKMGGLERVDHGLKGGVQLALTATAVRGRGNSGRGGEPSAENPGGKSALQTRQLTEAELKTYARVDPNDSTRAVVAEKYTDEGKLYDGVTGKEIKPGTPWVMGHKPGFEFRKMQADAAARGISREQWVAEQNNPNIYQPEHHSTSSRSAHEAPEHVSLPAQAAGTAHEDKY
jgi:RHS repeat-associated protein